MVGFVGLTLEIAYTRIVSFKLFYYYTYFVIGLALLGFGAAATVTALSDRLRRRDVLDTVRVLGPAVALLGVVSYLLVARVPTDVNQIWTSASIGRAGFEFLVVIVLALALTAVFFGLGLVISLLIVVESADVRRLYFWDLAGAALGCLLAVPLQRTIGPPAMVLLSLVAFAGLGLAIAVRRGHGLKLAGAGLALTAVAAFVTSGYDVRTDDTKTLELSDHSEGDWGAVFRVDAVDLGDLQILHHDGLWGSSIWRYDGTRATTARFDTDDRQIPWAALGRTPDRILIIGAAGGNEIQAALTYGVGHVDAVELNPVTHHLLTDTFADYSGNIATLPNVNYVQGDGRTFLARASDDYDLIWFVAPDSYAASNAATSGAFVLSESYLYTREMIETAFDHLTPNGLIVAQFGDFDFDTRPTRTARYLVTARDAIGDELGGGFDQHVILVVEHEPAELSRVSTIVLSPSAIDGDAVDRVVDAIGNVPGARAVHLPGGGGTEEGITGALIDSDDATVDQLVRDYEFDIRSISDDRPFFWHFTPFTDVLTNFSRGMEDNEIAIGERLLLMLLVVAVIVAAILLALPFLVTRKSGADRPPRVVDRWRLLVYFAALGFGFMVVEISMIQRFSLLLGYPTLSLSVSLFTLLIATALGARWSAWVQRDVRRRLVITVVAMWVITLTYLLVSDSVTDRVLAWSQGGRIALVIAMLFPIGVSLGMFLPTGVDKARELAGISGADTGRVVAWCWAVNGFFSVIGSATTTMLSMSFGFDHTMVIGLVLYAIATGVMVTGRVALREVAEEIVLIPANAV